MNHSPPPPGLGQDKSEGVVSRTARAKQREGLAGPLFSLSPNLRHTFETLPRAACGQAGHTLLFLSPHPPAAFLLLPCEPKLRERGWEGASARSFHLSSCL